MSKAVESYYNNSTETEWSRLDRHVLEFEITKRHIDQFLRPQDSILDVGGGPGKYAFHYASKGHRVTLLDLSPRNIAFATHHQTASGVPLEKCIVGNATSMPEVSDESHDFVLCMGPMYHLLELADRQKVLAECRRVLKPQGKILLSFVTHMAQTISVIKRSPGKLNLWKAALEKGIHTGINDVEFDTGFTEAFFIRPEAVSDFVASGGMTVLKVAGAEGLACQSEDEILKLEESQRKEWIDFLFQHSEDPSTLGANQHVICVAEKRGGGPEVNPTSRPIR